MEPIYWAIAVVGALLALFGALLLALAGLGIGLARRPERGVTTAEDKGFWKELVDFVKYLFRIIIDPKRDPMARQAATGAVLLVAGVGLLLGSVALASGGSGDDSESPTPTPSVSPTTA